MKEVSTWALGLRKGDSRDVEILVLRRDGFREPIEVWAEDLPKGVTCRGASIASNAKTAELIFTAAENAAEGAGFIRVIGKAKLPSPRHRRKRDSPPIEIVHEAIPATIVWSAEAGYARRFADRPIAGSLGDERVGPVRSCRPTSPELRSIRAARSCSRCLWPAATALTAKWR